MNNDEIQFKILKFLHDKHFAGEMMHFFTVEEIIEGAGLGNANREAVLGNLLYLYNKNFINGTRQLGVAHPTSAYINELGIDEYARLTNSDRPRSETASETGSTKKTRNLTYWTKVLVAIGIVSVVLIAVGLIVPYLNQHPSVENSNTSNINTSNIAQSNHQFGGVIVNSSHNAVSFNQSGGIQSSGQSGGITANSITGSVINQGTQQPASIALIDIKDVTNDGKIILPIGMNDKPYFESKLLLTGALPSDGVIYTKSIKFYLPQYDHSLFVLSTPFLVQQSIPPQPVQHGVLNLTIVSDIMESLSTNPQYSDRNDLPSYEVQGGNATFQFEYRSVQNNTQIFSFTDPLSIMVKGCLDENYKDTPCEKPAPPVQESISVNTDKTSYNRDDTVTIHGIVNSVIPNQSVTIQIQYHLGDLITKRSFTPNPDGTYAFQLPLGTLFSDGEYIVIANYGSAQNQTTFIVNHPTQP